jgi:hypothetical protein
MECWADLAQGVRRVIQPQPGENSTFNHLGEIGSEVKLIAFPEKSVQPKNSIPTPRHALKAEGTGHCSHTSFSQYHFGELAYSNKLTLTSHPRQEQPGLKHPEWIPPNLSGREGIIDFHKAQHTNSKKA